MWEVYKEQHRNNSEKGVARGVRFRNQFASEKDKVSRAWERSFSELAQIISQVCCLLNRQRSLGICADDTQSLQSIRSHRRGIVPDIDITHLRRSSTLIAEN